MQAVRRFVQQLPRDIVVVSGGARGVDRVAELAAKDQGLEIHIIWADWAGKGRDAGYLRNIELVQYCDAVVVFWDGASRGTSHVLGLARAAGKLQELIVTRRRPIRSVG